MIPKQQPDPAPPIALLAEDDELIRDLVAQYLQRLGYEVLEAPNGKVAIDILSRPGLARIDVVVTDLLMPHVGGEQVVREAQRLHACQRFLIISGFAHQMRHLDPAVRDQSLYLEKPFTFQAFEASLSELHLHA